MILDRDSPIEPHIARLDAVPSLAQVALAARCAQRVEPLFQASTQSLEPTDRAPVVEAIRVVEAVAQGKRPRVATLQTVHSASKAASKRCRDAFDEHHPSRRASACVTYAARAAWRYLDKMPGLALTDTCRAADRASQAAGDAAWMVDAIAVDVANLLSRRASGKHRASLEALFGDMWPHGEPVGWPRAVLASANAFTVGHTDTPTQLRRRLDIIEVCLKWPAGTEVSPRAIWERLGGDVLPYGYKTVENDLKSLGESLGNVQLIKSAGPGHWSVFTEHVKQLDAAGQQIKTILRLANGNNH